MAYRNDDAAWDRVWTGDPYRIPSLRAQRARSKVAAFVAVGLKIETTDRVLDLACGSGHMLIEAIEQTSTHRGRAAACDISTAATQLARENFKRSRLDAVVFCADAAKAMDKAAMAVARIAKSRTGEKSDEIKVTKNGDE